MQAETELKRKMVYKYFSTISAAVLRISKN